MCCLLSFVSVAFLQWFPVHLVPFGDRFPVPTLFRGYVVRTVQQEQVQRELGLSDDQKTYLKAFLQLLEQQEREATATLPANHDDARWQPVIDATEKRLDEFHRNLEEILGNQKWHRLQEIALHLWGPRVMLYPHLQRKLNLTVQQRDAIKSALAWHEGEALSLIAQRSIDYDAIVETARDERLLRILDRRQQELWQSLLGKPVSLVHRPTPTVHQLLRNSYTYFDRQERHSRAESRIHQQFPYVELARIPEVVKELNLAVGDTMKLDRFLQDYAAREKQRGGPVAGFFPRDFRDRERFTEETGAAMVEAEAELRKLLPPNKFHRFWQIRRQLCGIGCVFGHEERKAYGISQETNDRLDQRCNEIMNELNQEAAKPRSDEEILASGAKHVELIRAAMWEALTPAQQKKWQTEIGPPIGSKTQLAVREHFQRYSDTVQLPRGAFEQRFSMPPRSMKVPEFSR